MKITQYPFQYPPLHVPLCSMRGKAAVVADFGNNPTAAQLDLFNAMWVETVQDVKCSEREADTLATRSVKLFENAND